MAGLRSWQLRHSPLVTSGLCAKNMENKKEAIWVGHKSQKSIHITNLFTNIMNTRNTLITLIGIVVAVVVGVIALSNNREQPQSISQGQDAQSADIEEKIYVAIEGEGKVAVVDPVQKKVLTTIDLTDRSGSPMGYMAHNVQVAPDGKSVWVTANAMEKMAMGGEHEENDSEGMGGMEEPSDQVIAIDPSTDKITKRISISPDNHLAHVVISPDSKKAYVTAQKKGLVYTISTATFAIEKTVDLGTESGPHGLRASTDGAKAFIALLDGKALAALDISSGKVQKYPFESGTVQTAVTPDGRYAFVSLYSTKQIARLDIAAGKIEKIDLPLEAKGPVQLYPTPDSRFIYVADQGYYFDQPTSDKVYRISVEDNAVNQTISAGSAPHGVVVDSVGKFVYITNLLSDDVSIIDAATGKETARIPVGDMPNGISIWNRTNGGTP